MSEHNVVEKNILEEQAVNEEPNNESEKTEVFYEESRTPFIKSLCAAIIDEISICIISIILLYLFDALLKFAGYSITEKIGMFLIIFVVISILYRSITEAINHGKTIGKKLINL